MAFTPNVALSNVALSMDDLRKRITDVTVAYDAYAHQANRRIGELSDTITTLQAEVKRLTAECGILRDEFGHACYQRSRLCAEAERLQGEIKLLQDDTVAKLESALHEVGEINKRLRGALTFYATIDLYANTFGDSMTKLLSDNGHIAQWALEGQEGV
jgi:FtsZ-binding cell division protein ZapB